MTIKEQLEQARALVARLELQEETIPFTKSLANRIKKMWDIVRNIAHYLELARDTIAAHESRIAKLEKLVTQSTPDAVRERIANEAKARHAADDATSDRINKLAKRFGDDQ